MAPTCALRAPHLDVRPGSVPAAHSNASLQRRGCSQPLASGPLAPVSPSQACLQRRGRTQPMASRPLAPLTPFLQGKGRAQPLAPGAWAPSRVVGSYSGAGRPGSEDRDVDSDQGLYLTWTGFLTQLGSAISSSREHEEEDARHPRHRGGGGMPGPAPVLDAKVPSSSVRMHERCEWANRRRTSLFGLALMLGLPPALPGWAEPVLQAPAQSESATSAPALPARTGPDTTVTDKVFLEFRMCPTRTRQDRTLGDMSLICSDGEPLGRVVIGLYGNQVPVTTQHFKAMVTGAAGSTLKGSIIHKTLQGQYIMGGHQGSVDKGEVRPPSKLERNPETIASKSFLLNHQRPGTVSLALSENDDETDRRMSSEYRNVEFLITTGPGPASQLDNGNIVFGRVLEGLDVVSAIAAVPTYLPNDQIRQFNDLAQFLGDERAAKGRQGWNKPLKAVVISDCGVVGPSVAVPLLPPSLP